MRDPDACGLYKRGGVWWLAQQRNLKRVFVSLETSDYETAVGKAKNIRESPDLNQGGLLKAEADRYRSEKMQNGGFSRHTAETARVLLGKMADFFGNKAPQHVNEADAKRFYAHLKSTGITDVTVMTYIAYCRSFFKWCVADAKTIRTNPFAVIRNPDFGTMPSRRDFCTAKVRDRLIANCTRPDLKFILFCGFHAGMRRNEIVEARPEWFDLTVGVVRPQNMPPNEAAKRGLDPFKLKDGEERTVPLSKAFKAFLKSFEGMTGDYCIGRNVRRGAARYRYDFIRFFNDYVAAQGHPDVGPHKMRRTFGSLHAINGTPLYHIAKFLGDDERTTARHYAHLAPDRKLFEKGIG